LSFWGWGRADRFPECFYIVPRELTVEGGDLTPSLKVKRRVLAERYGREIAELYR
jgi:long-chain acyl-CoA synthetase